MRQMHAASPLHVSQEAVLLHGIWKGKLEFTHFPFQESLNTPPMRIWYNFKFSFIYHLF